MIAKQYVKARRNLEAAYKMDKADPGGSVRILNNLALAVARGPEPDLEYSLELIAELMDLLPEAKHPEVFSTRAEILVKMERYEEADRDLQKALAERPRSATVHELLITVKENLGDNALADEHRRILKELQEADQSDGAE